MKKLLPIKLLLVPAMLLVSNLSIAQVYSGTTTVSAANNMTITVTVKPSLGEVELVMTGPSAQWFGYGFGGSSMFNTYALINMTSGNVDERKLGNHSAGSALSSSLISSNTSVSGGIRTNTVKRALTGSNSNYFTFPNNAGSISLIWARGSSSSFSGHSTRGSAVITLSNACNIPVTTLSPINICMGDSALVFGSFETQAGTYQQTLSAANGCDSVVEQEIFVNPTGTYTLPDVTICEGDSALIFGQYQTMASLYSQTDTTAFGCDSISEITLIVNSADTSVVATDSTLMAVSTGSTYAWIDCNTGLAVPNATSQTFIPDTSGLYALQITENGCTSTSSCYSLTASVGLQDYSLGNISLYPNPATDVLHLDVNGEWLNSNIIILNSSGVILRSESVSQLKSMIDITDLASGLYILKIENDNSSQSFNFIKN